MNTVIKYLVVIAGLFSISVSILHSGNKKKRRSIDSYVNAIKNVFENYRHEFYKNRIAQLNSIYADKLINQADTNRIKMILRDRDNFLDHLEGEKIMNLPALNVNYGMTQFSKDSLVKIFQKDLSDCTWRIIYFYKNELVLIEIIQCTTSNIYYYKGGKLVYYEDNEIDSKAAFHKKGNYLAKYYFKDDKLIDSTVTGKPSIYRQDYSYSIGSRAILKNSGRLYTNDLKSN